MTWEIVVGIFTMIGAFVSVVSAAVKINRAIVLLEAAVNELKQHTKAQDEQNLRTSEKLERLDRRVLHLERKKSTKYFYDQQQL